MVLTLSRISCRSAWALDIEAQRGMVSDAAGLVGAAYAYEVLCSSIFSSCRWLQGKDASK